MRLKTISMLLAAGAVFGAVSCNKDNGGVRDDAQNMAEMTFMNGTSTKGYVDGTTFYEKATADMHGAGVVATSRRMVMSAYYRLQDAASGENYFVGSEFAENGTTGIWHHSPAYYWPLDSDMDFLAYSSSEPFSAKDAQWNATDASKGVTLNMTRARCQDDILYCAAQMASSEATEISSGVYTVAQPVTMEFQHAQAWLEFQLSIAAESMKDKIAIKEIVVENLYDKGKLNLTRTDATAAAAWDFTGVTTSNIVFDDNYEVYGRVKADSEYTAENTAISSAQSALATAQASGNVDAITAAEAALQAAQDTLAAHKALSPLINPLNVVGEKNSRSDYSPASAGSGAETGTDCKYMDMLIPQQNKTAFVIRYILAGNPEVLEYRYNLAAGSGVWQMGHKYVYDIDFVVSEITVAPTVKAYEATFDGTDLSPVEII